MQTGYFFPNRQKKSEKTKPQLLRVSWGITYQLRLVCGCYSYPTNSGRRRMPNAVAKRKKLDIWISASPRSTRET